MNNMWKKIKILVAVCILFLVASFFIFNLSSYNNNEKYNDKNFSKMKFFIQNNENILPNVINPWHNFSYDYMNEFSKETICPLWPRNILGKLQIHMGNYSWNEIDNNHTNIKNGGYHKPIGCESRHKVAIIVPYKNRESHLKIFLNHMHPLLSRQDLDYKIYIIEEADNFRFNRAMLFNVGYLEAMLDYNWDCFIFHDVDLLPEDDRNLYTCPESPRHMSVAVDTLKYKLPYKTIFGGVVAFNKQDFVKVNGFSNQFWGWGGEDDDMYNRVKNKKLTLSRYSASIARYTMIQHIKAKPNKSRRKILKMGSNFYETDGLNNVKYEIQERKKFQLYTKISVFLKKVLPLKKIRKSTKPKI